MANIKGKIMINLENKVVLITGGTGSFGEAFLKKLLENSCGQIRIFSRDEKKQDDLRKKFSGENVKFYLGDVRDYQSIVNSMRGVDFVFHAAAYKQVPSCEFHPIEAVKTNILGTENVLEAAINCGVEKVVCLSTDKSVYPINAMGISKAMMEKVAIAKARQSSKTTISITRYGNVMGSRGSVIPLFEKQIERGVPLTITNPKMTRFLMTLDEAVELVLFAFNNANTGDIFVQKTSSCHLDDLAVAVYESMGRKNYPLEILGTRHGEKKHEVLLSKEEVAVAEEFDNYFKVSPDNRDLDYQKYVEQGDEKLNSAVEYSSANSRILNVEEIKQMLNDMRFL